MSVNSLNQVSQQLPPGATSFIFSGFSNQGDYTYTTSLPAGNYIAYAPPLSTFNWVNFKSNNLATNIAATTIPSGFVYINTTAAETAVQFSSQYQTLTRPGVEGVSGPIWDGSLFYICGATKTNLFVSTDGFSWTTRTPVFPTAQTTGTIAQPIAYNASMVNKYVIAGTASAGNGTSGCISTSTNGVTWTGRSLQYTITAGTSLIAPLINNALTNKYVVCNPNASTSEMPHTSTDGVTWTARSVPTQTFGLLGYGATSGGTTGRTYIYTSSNAATGPIFASTDAVTWAWSTLPGGTFGAQGIAYGAGLYLVGVTTNTTTYFTSPDGTTWTQRSLPTTPVSASIQFPKFENGRFIGFAAQSAVFSTDGINWTYSLTGAAGGSSSQIAWNGTRYVVGNSGGNIATQRPQYYALYSTSGTTTLN